MTGKACPDSMVFIHHACYAVKSEAIELKYFHVEPQVAQQEPQNFMVVVIKQTTVPEFVLPFPAFVEILVVGTIKLVQSVQDIFAGMRMNDVEKYRQTHAMSGINEFFQILGTPIARASCKKASDLVAKCWMCGQLNSFLSMLKDCKHTCIICVFHDSHELDGVVSEILYPR